MKYKILWVLFLVLCSLSTEIKSQTLYLSNWFEVANASIYGKHNPQITTVNASTPLISWGRAGANPAMFVSLWNNGFGTPLQITQNGQLPMSSTVESPEFGIYGDTVYLVYAEHVSSSIYLHRSFNAGLTFSDSILVYSLPGNHLAFPAVEVDDYGNPIVAFLKMEMNETDPYLFVCKSNDAGNSFSLPQDVTSLNSGKPCECCPLDITHSGDTMVVTYRNNISNMRDFYTVISYNNGQSFTTGARVDFTNFNINQCPTNGVKTIIQRDTLYAVWSSRVGSSYRVKKGALSLTDLQAPPNNFIDNSVASNVNQSQCSFHGKNDTLAVVWHDNRNGTMDIFLSYSVNGFYNFSAPVLINNPAIGGGQQYPDVVYSKGTFHITYIDVFSDKIMYRKVGFDPVLGAPNIILNDHLLVFPTLFNDVIYINAEEEMLERVVVYDLNGRKVFDKNIKSTTAEINLNYLHTGVYILELSSQSSSVFHKKIVKH